MSTMPPIDGPTAVMLSAVGICLAFALAALGVWLWRAAREWCSALLDGLGFETR